MKSHHNVTFTPEARRDLRNILRHSRKIWGDRQRAIYAARLDRGIEYLTLFPEIGDRRDRLSPGLRAHTIEQRVVYYLLDDSGIVVIRLLHSRSDADEAFRM